MVFVVIFGAAAGTGFFLAIISAKDVGPDCSANFCCLEFGLDPGDRGIPRLRTVIWLESSDDVSLTPCGDAAFDGEWSIGSTEAAVVNEPFEPLSIWSFARFGVPD